MRGLDRGESYVVTRNGVPVGELRPVRRRRFVAADVVIGAFAASAPIDAGRFYEDVDRGVDQDPTPRVSLASLMGPPCCQWHGTTSCPPDRLA